MGSAVVTLAGAESLRPGEPGVVLVTVTNVGSTVEAYDLVVLGDLAQFATVAPPEVRLLPGQQESATVTLVVSTEIPSGAVPLGVKVQPQAGTAEAVVEERELQVMAVTELTVRAVPMVLRTRRRGEARVEVENTGNATVTAALSVTDPNDELSAALHPVELTVAPHAVATARLTLRSLAPRGASIGYTIGARTPDGRERLVEARMETSRRRVLPWVAFAAVLLLGAVVASTQLGAGDAEGNLFSSVNTATPIDSSTSSSDGVGTTTILEAPTTQTAGPSSSTGETTGPTAPLLPGASTTRATSKPGTPPTATFRTTTTPPPCSPAPCANVAKNSTGKVIFDTRTVGRDANGDLLVVSAVTQPRHGTAWIGDGRYTVLYTPTRDYVGSDDMVVNVTDSRGVGSNSAPVKLTVY